MFYFDPVTSWILNLLISTVGCPLAIGCNNWFFGQISVLLGIGLAGLAAVIFLKGRGADDDYVEVG